MIKLSTFLFIFLIHTEQNSVLTLNMELSRLEENLLYSYLKNQTNLKLVYGKLIESHGINNLHYARPTVTDQDIQQNSTNNKVNIHVKYIE